MLVWSEKNDLTNFTVDEVTTQTPTHEVTQADTDIELCEEQHSSTDV